MLRFTTIFVLVFIIACKAVIAEHKIMFSNNYPPYNYTDENGELVGFNIDIINAINEIYDNKIIINGDNWKAINEALENGEIDAIGGTHFPGTYDHNHIYPRSTINTSHCFFYNSNYFENFSLKSFRTIHKPLVALWNNDVLIHYVTSLNPTAKFLYISNYDELLNAVNREDVTCVFGQRIATMYNADKLGIDYIVPMDNRILERNMGFKVSRDNQELADMINNGLEVLMANGEYQNIYDKWITVYNKNHNDWQKYLRYILFGGIFIVIVILILIALNWVLQSRVRSKTKDLRQQLDLNSRIMKELEKQKVKAEESDKMKSAFLANMSHEIRTPMNGILGFTDLLKSADYSSESQANFISIIQKSGNRMLDTINNIIDASKLESDLEKLQITEVDIPSIIVELVNFFTPEANSKGLKLNVRKNGSSSYTGFYSDGYKLNSILTNLIKNALKFTSEGSVEIKYSLNDDLAEFWITDTGIGIAPEKQKYVFDQLAQADYSYSSGFEGSGLGLSISKGYAEILGGEISLESELNKGSSFYVRIPNNGNRKPVTKNSVINKEVQKSGISKNKIIIVEDDEISYEYLKYALEDVASTIIHAKDGIEAIDLAKENLDTDIILMDIKMPRLNGFDTTKEIRKFNKEVYIIAQSAYTQENYRKKIIESGCNSYISKPIDLQELLEQISMSVKS